mgnify:CR=1 FL=1
MQLGAAVDEIDHQHWTPLFWAASKGHADVVVQLHAAGASVHVHGGGQATPLHVAAGEGHVAVVKVLLRAGAKLDAQDANGRSPEGYAELHSRPGAREVLQAGKDEL